MLKIAKLDEGEDQRDLKEQAMLLIVQMQKTVNKILSEQGIVEEHKKGEGENDQDARY